VTQGWKPKWKPPLPSSHSDALGTSAEQCLAFRIEGKSGEEFCQVVSRGRAAKHGCMGTSLVEGAGERQGIRRNGVNMRKGVGSRGGFDGPGSRFLELAESHERHGARGEHAEEHRIERAQLSRVVRVSNGRARIALR
jgi:hypothetical protein